MGHTAQVFGLVGGNADLSGLTLSQTKVKILPSTRYWLWEENA